MKNLLFVFAVVFLSSCVKETISPTNPKNQGNPLNGTGTWTYDGSSSSCSDNIRFVNYDFSDYDLYYDGSYYTLYGNSDKYIYISGGTSGVSVDVYYYGGGYISSVTAYPCSGGDVYIDF